MAESNKKGSLVTLFLVVIVVAGALALANYLLKNIIEASSPTMPPALPRQQTIQILGPVNSKVMMTVLLECYTSEGTSPFAYSVYGQVGILRPAQTKGKVSFIVSQESSSKIQTAINQLKQKCRKVDNSLIAFSLDKNVSGAKTWYSPAIAYYTLDIETGQGSSGQEPVIPGTGGGTTTGLQCPLSNQWVSCRPCTSSTPEGKKQCEEQMEYCKWVRQNCPNAQIAY